MTIEVSELIKKLETADRTRPNIESLANRFVEVPVLQYGQILKTLMDCANDKAIGTMLLVAAVNKPWERSGVGFVRWKALKRSKVYSA